MCSFVVSAEGQNEDSSGTRNSHNMRIRRRGRIAARGKKFKMTLICTKFGDRSSGLTKVCYYDCSGFEAATAVNVYDECPSWTPRWRLNQNSQFGPSEISH